MFGQVFYLNTAESATYNITIYNKVNGVVAVTPLAGKEVHFYVKVNEQDLDEDAIIHKYTGSGIVAVGDGTSGACLLSIVPADTEALLYTNVTHDFYWSLRLIDGSTVIHISEGNLVVTPK